MRISDWSSDVCSSDLRALAADLGLQFDPLDVDFARDWRGARPAVLLDMSKAQWRSRGDTVERLELLAKQLVGDRRLPDEDWLQTRAVLDAIDERLRPAVLACGPTARDTLLRGARKGVV